eukprot:823420-Prymnesium_polylepis.2
MHETRLFTLTLKPHQLFDTPQHTFYRSSGCSACATHGHASPICGCPIWDLISCAHPPRYDAEFGSGADFSAPGISPCPLR